MKMGTWWYDVKRLRGDTLSVELYPSKWMTRGQYQQRDFCQFMILVDIAQVRVKTQKL